MTRDQDLRDHPARRRGAGGDARRVVCRFRVVERQPACRVPGYRARDRCRAAGRASRRSACSSILRKQRSMPRLLRACASPRSTRTTTVFIRDARIPVIRAVHLAVDRRRRAARCTADDIDPPRRARPREARRHRTNGRLAPRRSDRAVASGHSRGRTDACQRPASDRRSAAVRRRRRVRSRIVARNQESRLMRRSFIEAARFPGTKGTYGTSGTSK